MIYDYRVTKQNCYTCFIRRCSDKLWHFSNKQQQQHKNKNKQNKRENTIYGTNTRIDLILAGGTKSNEEWNLTTSQNSHALCKTSDEEFVTERGRKMGESGFERKL